MAGVRGNCSKVGGGAPASPKSSTPLEVSSPDEPYHGASGEAPSCEYSFGCALENDCKLSDSSKALPFGQGPQAVEVNGRYLLALGFLGKAVACRAKIEA